MSALTKTTQLPLDYTAAPACTMLATRCAFCSRKLLDALSVESGIGPDCAELHGVERVAATHRKEANELIYQIAVLQRTDWNRTALLLDRLTALGFFEVVSKITARFSPKPTILIETIKAEIGEAFKVVAPYRAQATEGWRSIPGRRFIQESIGGAKVSYNLVPARSRAALWAFLQTYYQGEVVQGSKGVRVI